MELREYAERVLFATSIEEKLRGPESPIVDEAPGIAITVPEAPGRPANLSFKTSRRGSSEFPGLQRLEREEERGRLLHFFANHEMLATELMALVLLRFPDAPKTFRRGVLQTLRDEQEHTRLYLERMRACGIQFGDIPVSGYFWRAVSSMESPMDYVAGLSLTFEQANLDFARHFSAAFAAVGDSDTATLLERIYKDEIAHVAYGLKWFRRWKNPSESDWDAFCKQLKYPLTPQRAKGFTLNVDGRKSAGFEPAFIAELDIFSASKGRTPGVHVFNPFAEGYIAKGMSFAPVKHQALILEDIANLPQFLCRQDDIVLVPKRPSVGFLSSVKQAGFPLPEFVETAAVESLCSRNIGALKPWAWAPDSVKLMRPLIPSVTGERRTLEQRFNEKIAALYSKAWSAEFLRKVLKSWADSGNECSWLCDPQQAGVVADSVEAAIQAVSQIRARGHHRVVIKESLGLAGGNALRLWEPEILESQRSWIANVIKSGGQLVVEPWLDRVADFSIQLEMEPGGLKLRGYTGLVCDKTGRFRGNWAEPNFLRKPPGNISALFPSGSPGRRQLDSLLNHVAGCLEDRLRRFDFVGPVGIDAFVYRQDSGEVRLKPVVELNPRYTMGRLTIELMKHVAPGSGGLFQILKLSDIRSLGFDGFPAFAMDLRSREHVELAGSPNPKMEQGTLLLNDPVSAVSCLAVFRVSRRLPELLDSITG